MTQRATPKVRVRRPIPLLIVCFCATVCNGFMVYKFVPIITTLMEYWHVGESSIGTLQSANSWAAVFLLIPIGYLQSKFKPRFSGGLALAFMVVGNAIGILAPSFIFLIIGRILEGLGAITINTLTQNLILNSFGDRRTTAIGILNCGQYVGQAINILMANAFVVTFGWQAVYTYMCILELVFAVVWVIFANNSVTIAGLRDPALPDETPAPAQKKAPATPKHGMGSILKNKSLWLLIICSALYGPTIAQFSTYIPTYLSMRGMDVYQANSIFNITVVFGVISMASVGFLSDKLGTKRKIAAISYFVTVVLYYLLMKIPLGMIVVLLVFIGLIPRTLSVLTFSSIPMLVSDTRDVPLANSLLAMIGQVANIVGHIFLGFMLEKVGYGVTIYVLMGMMAVAGMLWISNRAIR